MSMDRRLVGISKFLSKVLRHRPAMIQLQLDSGGWASIDDLLAGAAQHGFAFSRDELEQVVRENDKGRFALNPDGTRIRAVQGHSIPVDLNLQPQAPPEILYHGTARRFLASIQADGLLPGRRNYVHLSRDRETAQRVGQRHGAPLVLEVEAGRLHASGEPFYCSENGVWLVKRVPPAYLRFPQESE